MDQLCFNERKIKLEYQVLRCRECAIKNQDRQPEQPKEHNIGWLIAAVPTEEGDTFWGYTSVPPEVRLCPNKGCANWPYRMGKRGDKKNNEHLRTQDSHKKDL